MKAIGITFLASGIIFVAIGLAFLFADKVPWIGNLPGDFHFKSKSMKFHIPLMSCLLISLVLTIVVNVVLRIFGK